MILSRLTAQELERWLYFEGKTEEASLVFKLIEELYEADYNRMLLEDRIAQLNDEIDALYSAKIVK